MAGNFNMQTSLEIIERLKSNYQNIAGDNAKSVIEGTFAFDTLSANAQEFEKTYAEMNMLIDASFLQTSWGEYLDMLADQLAGLTRRLATASSVELTIIGAQGANVPVGSFFATAGGITFATLDVATIGLDGSVRVKAISQETGIKNNVDAGTVTVIPSSIYGVSSVTNDAAAYDGYNEEDDESLRERALFAVRQPATSGNVYHYILWAMSVPGVGAVKVLPLWDGNGTVKIIVVDANTDTPSADLLKNVTNELAKNIPVGAKVTVVAPTTLVVNISLTCTKGTPNAIAIKEVLTAYFKTNVFGTNHEDIGALDDDVTISYAQIGRIILDNVSKTGVIDYTNMLVNGGMTNIIIAAEDLPIVGTVTLNES